LDDHINETLFDMKLGETNDSKYILWDSVYIVNVYITSDEKPVDVQFGRKLVGNDFFS
jgi:hypothetical protein